MMRIILADEISPDSCRLLDLQTHQRMDIDALSGKATSAHSEIARRLGIMNENEPSRATGPVLVK
nr:phosphoribosylaminoimidazolesuccinocarboxamide synthase [Marinicella sp. W31]MDC2877143.1 phosphoribosylaminoimidazolesuccinocarboxamide synthase [Marinicella sp. W31]